MCNASKRPTVKRLDATKRREARLDPFYEQIDEPRFAQRAALRRQMTLPPQSQPENQ